MSLFKVSAATCGNALRILQFDAKCLKRPICCALFFSFSDVFRTQPAKLFELKSRS